MFTTNTSLLFSPKQQKSKRTIVIATQQAIRAIDNYQRRQYTFRQQIFNKNNQYTQYIKSANLGEINRVQLLADSSQFFKIPQNKNNNYKIVITNIRGGQFTLCIGFDKKYPNQFKNNGLYKVYKQSIINIKNKLFLDLQFIYLGIYCKNSLLMFNFRIQLQKIRVDSQISVEQQQNLIQPLKNIKSMELSNLSKKRNKSVSLIRKNKYESKRTSPDKQLQKIRKKQIQEDRFQTVKQKKQTIQIYKKKDKQLKNLASICKKLMQSYQKQSNETKLIKKQINIQLSKLIYTAKILSMFHHKIQHRQNQIKSALKSTKILQRAKHLFMKNYYKVKKQISNQKYRNLISINLFITFNSKLIIKQSQNKSIQIVSFILLNVKIPTLINKILDSASYYRRACRKIQRYWKTKFIARTIILQKYAMSEGEKFIQTIRKFKIIEKIFKNSQICYKLAIQYQADQASKVNNYVEAYQKKMQQVNEILQMNQQIKKFNATALKKRVKKCLDIPPIPSLPQHRFFRNIDNLKSLVRGWLQLQYRKQTKKLKSL